MTIQDDIQESIEAMFYTPNYCDLYQHVNQVRELMGFSNIFVNDVVTENKWVIEQFRKFVGTHRVPIMRFEGQYQAMLETVEGMIQKLEEQNGSPKEILYMYLRDEWMSQMHAVIQQAIEALAHIEDEEDYDA